MTENNTKLREIDFGKILQIVCIKKKKLAINCAIAFVISAALILCVPRYYMCDVKLAPETNNMNMGGSLSSLASSFGLNMSNLTSQDAIVPELYPDLMESVDFRTSMFSVSVKTKKGDLRATYYDYIVKHQKFAWWDLIVGKIKKMFEKRSDGNGKNKEINPFMLTKEQNDVVKVIGGKIKCSVDKKTDVITISVEDQDPLVCATIADSARVRLQDAIIKYRTKKARIDLEYAKKT